MNLPKVRLTVNSAESSLLTPGLHALAAGLRSAEYGDFPDRYTDALGSWNRNLYRDRHFDLKMAGKILSAHQKLVGLATSRKVRLDLFEIAVAGFALRLSKGSSVRSGHTAAAASLSRKLERYRKRAKRRAEARFGKAEMTRKAKTWRAFISWCRVNVLRFRLPLPDFGFRRRKFWAQQRASMAEMIRLGLEEGGYEALTGAQMQRMVRLIKEEFHRGRHPVTLGELLRGDHAASRALLLKIVVKKLELIPTSGPNVPLCIRQSENAERIRAALAARRQASVPAELPPALLSEIPREFSVPPVSAKPFPQSNSGRKIALSEQELSMAVAKWLMDHVDSQLWQPVAEQARFAIQNRLAWGKQIPTYRNFSDLIRKSRPHEESYDPTEVLSDLALRADWLFTWVTELQSDPAAAYKAIVYGYGNALQLQKSIVGN